MYRVILPRKIRIQGRGEVSKKHLKEVLKKLTKEKLLTIIRSFNEEVKIKNYSTLKKDKLINLIVKKVIKSSMDDETNELYLKLGTTPKKKLKMEV